MICLNILALTFSLFWFWNSSIYIPLAPADEKGAHQKQRHIFSFLVGAAGRLCGDVTMAFSSLMNGSTFDRVGQQICQKKQKCQPINQYLSSNSSSKRWGALLIFTLGSPTKLLSVIYLFIYCRNAACRTWGIFRSRWSEAKQLLYSSIKVSGRSAFMQVGRRLMQSWVELIFLPRMSRASQIATVKILRLLS